jgi:hypothetical protein
MRMHVVVKGLLLAGMLAVPGVSRAAAGDVPQDPKVVEFINKFCADIGAAAQASDNNDDVAVSELGKKAVKYFHKSHYDNTGANLKADRLRFSFKKGSGDLKFYDCPVKITRVRKTGTTAIGFKETGEKGAVYDYFLAKKAGVSGMPAQIRIFVSETGGIWIDDVGSL